MIKPLLLLSTAAFVSCVPKTTNQAQKPNIILILADDMGYSDLGCYGGEIPTPNLDQLAEDGLRFTNFYNTSRSCPTRASLLTGLYQHQTGVGMMTTEGGSDFDFGVEGYRGYLNNNCVTIAEVLKDNGYNTYMTGKWHLGSDTPDKQPLQRGFDKFFGSYQGAFSYFDPKGDRCLIDGNDTIPAWEGFYTTDAFTDKAIEFIHNQKDDNPFFLYLAYNAPHWPLHAKNEDIELFVGKYMKGWDVLREERFVRQKEMGLFDESTHLSSRDQRVRSWTEVSEEQKILSDYRMAVYAAQVYSMDYNIGKLITFLKGNNQLENTIIIFMSDNGACAEPYSEFGGGKQSDINNPDLWGSISYGLAWANLSNTPFRLYKNTATEGGIAAPCIISWPQQMESQKGKFAHTTSHILDIMPTILDITHSKYPKNYNNHRISPLEGISLLPTLIGEEQDRDGYLFFEHSYNTAIIKGEWKATSRIGNDRWALFNLKEDPTELNDVAAEYPEIVSDFAAQWHEWALRCKVLPKGVRTKNSYD